MSTSQRKHLYSAEQIQPHHIVQALQSLGYLHTDRVHQLRAGSQVRLPALDKPATNRGACVYLYPDGQGAYFRDWTTGYTQTIWPEKKSLVVGAEAAQLFREAEQRKRKAKADILVRQSECARYAQSIWQNADGEGTHRYIESKALTGLHTARIETSTGSLLIPMWVSGVGLVNIQRIFPNGTKRFLSGGRVNGAFSVIGSLNNTERVLIAEGWATAATLYESSKLPVVVAFNANNLMAVCQSVRSRFADIHVVVAGDDDRSNDVNIGRKKATEAAAAIGARITFPELCRCCRCSDFNDQARCPRGAGQ